MGYVALLASGTHSVLILMLATLVTALGLMAVQKLSYDDSQFLQQTGTMRYA